jgi:molybdopterin-guanine dinucleotide biosynthesis protein A
VFDAIVLAGGDARRMHGADKALLSVGGARLLERVLAAVSGAGRSIVVGPHRDIRAPADPCRLMWRREQPAGGGPVAAVAAGLEAVTAARVVVLAADLPWIAPAVPVLLAALDGDAGADAACLADADGRINYLAAAWRTTALRRALDVIDNPAGASMRALSSVAALRTVPDPDSWSRDCDTWDDLAQARTRYAKEER